MIGLMMPYGLPEKRLLQMDLKERPSAPSEELRMSSQGGGFRSLSIIVVVALFAMMIIPFLEISGRRITGIGIPGAAAWLKHLTLWLGLLGAVLATMTDRHIAIATTKIFDIKRGKVLISFVAGLGAVTVLISLTIASFKLVYFQYASPESIGGWFPVWLAQLAMPLAFLVMAVFTALKSTDGWKQQLVLFLTAIIFGIALDFIPEDYRYLLTFPGLILFIVLAFIGMPLYTVLGGISLLLLYAANIPVAALPVESYRILTQPVLPSIPLFALSGTIFAAGGAPQRLVRVVKAWTNWLPGGAAITTVCGCALFTAVTGASGVTILALGGILLPVLMAANHEKRFAIGLLTTSGSVGLLFPPSLPVILYGIYGHVAIDRLFFAAFFPGILLILMLAGVTLYTGQYRTAKRGAFDIREALRATWIAKGDLVLPVMVVFGLFGGVLTLVETAALVAVWAVLMETVFHRAIDLRKDLVNSMVEAAILAGALLIVLGLASGLVSYMVDEQIPSKATELVKRTIDSKWVFLLLLNGVLLLVGALMDIFSAIIVVVPLIVPLGVAFGVDPAQLGVIFLANLELGYLTPPVGMNLFFSSLRFKQPLLEIWKTVIPFLVVLGVWVLLITYVPFITVGIAKLFGN
jgi:tripartite ATP-independent transporter DctM subunit